MRWLKFGLILCVLFSAALPAHGERLLAALGGYFDGADDAGAILEIDPETGDITLLAQPMPGFGLSGIAALPSGRVFVTTESPDLDTAAKLLEIDPVSGALVRVVTDEVLWMGSLPFPIHDLAADPTTGLLYAAGYGGLDQVVSIDPDTGETTFIWGLVYSPFPIFTYSALAFDGSGNLWSKVWDSGVVFLVEFLEGKLIVNPQPASPPNFGALGMGIRRSDDKVFFSECCTQTQGNEVYSMDPPVYAAELLATMGGSRQVHDLAFAGAPPAVVEVPTLSPGALALLVCLLAIGAAVVLRRRRLEGRRGF